MAHSERACMLRTHSTYTCHMHMPRVHATGTHPMCAHTREHTHPLCAHTHHWPAHQGTGSRAPTAVQVLKTEVIYICLSGMERFSTTEVFLYFQKQNWSFSQASKPG